jgi:hypothetical protein
VSSSNQTQMTVLYITTTGHIVGGLTRTDASAPSPKVADLVGTSLPLRSAPNFQASTGTVMASLGTFVVPAADLSTVDVSLDQVGTYPWGEAIVQNPPSGGGASTVSVSNALTPYPSGSLPGAEGTPTGGRIVVTFTSLSLSSSTAYYIVPAPPPGVRVPVTPVSGVVSSTPISFSLPVLSTGSYTLLMFAQNMQPLLIPVT